MSRIHHKPFWEVLFSFPLVIRSLFHSAHLATSGLSSVHFTNPEITLIRSISRIIEVQDSLRLVKSMSQSPSDDSNALAESSSFSSWMGYLIGGVAAAIIAIICGIVLRLRKSKKPANDDDGDEMSESSADIAVADFTEEFVVSQGWGDSDSIQIFKDFEDES
jgi:hypothetical protein